MCMLLQIVIQLQKFAEAVSRIKGAVGSVNDKKAPAAAPAGKSAYSSEGVFGRDLSSMLSTDLTGIDPSLGGEFKGFPPAVCHHTARTNVCPCPAPAGLGSVGLKALQDLREDFAA